MKTSITKINIAEPCSQNWELMEKRDQQRFCASCNKCVIDFSTYTNAQIIQILANSTDEVCGRLSRAQLDQLNYHLVVAPVNRNWMKYLGVMAIGASIFAQNANASIPTTPVPIATHVNFKNDDKKPSPVKRIYGYVLDEDKKPMAGIKVAISNTKLFALTDKNGRYEINLGNRFNQKNKQLFIESIRFDGDLIIDFSREKQQDMFAGYLHMIMGKVAITSPIKK